MPWVVEKMTFCRDSFWNSSLTWNTTHPQFTECFEDTILIGIPCLVLWISAPWWLFYFIILKKNRSQFPRPKRKYFTYFGKVLGWLTFELWTNKMGFKMLISLNRDHDIDWQCNLQNSISISSISTTFSRRLCWSNSASVFIYVKWNPCWHWKTSIHSHISGTILFLAPTFNFEVESVYFSQYIYGYCKWCKPNVAWICDFYAVYLHFLLFYGS